MNPKPNPDEIRRALWKKGVISWKLRPVQLRIKSAIENSSSIKYVINSARRIGKSFTLCVMAIEDALSIEEAQIRFASPTHKMLKKILLPIMRTITKDMQPELKPTYNSVDGVFYFPSTGSEIHMAGASMGNEENLRGLCADRCYIDEAGYIPNLKYLVEDVLMPQLITTRNKKNRVKGSQLVMCSTPPKTPAHDFAEYIHKAEKDGNYSCFDIYSAGYDDKLIELFKIECGGENSSTWRREYLCQLIVDEDYALVPEWRDNYSQEPDFDSNYKYYEKIVSMDVGICDFTAILFGYYDFSKAILYIIDEIIMSGKRMTTEKLATAIKNKEQELWGELASPTRIADNNSPLLLQDLSIIHELHFSPTKKETLDVMLNQLRVWVDNGRIIIDPKCKHLLGCMRYGVWDESRTKFARSSVYGHYDGLAALMYAVRNVDAHTNPIPDFREQARADYFIRKNPSVQYSVSKTVLEMLGQGKLNND